MEPLPTGFYPFWFWNDAISADEIRWQVAQMAAQGVLGFFIHSRQGLTDPAYLSETFLDRISDAVEAAQSHGMVVHLYDEYPYPSGIAGGLVVMGEPAFLATDCFQQAFDLEGGEQRLELPEGKVLSLLAFPVEDQNVDWTSPLDLTGAVGSVLREEDYQETGLTRYNQKRFFANRPGPCLQAQLPPGRWRVVASVQRVVRRFKYWDHFSDVLQPQAVARFLGLTHERYFRRLGAHFGKTIRWIFTDEVIPTWSAGLPEAFQREYGYDLLPLLPALLDASHPDHLRVAVDLHRLKLKLFSQNFEEPVSSWCRAHEIAYAAEKPSLRYSQLRFQDIPGCEPGHVKAGGKLDLLQPALRGNAKATASAAYFYSKDGALDECYHSLGWSATLEDIRWMADAQLLLGIRYLVPHGFFYSTHNLRKHDAPPSLFFQAPYWPLFHRLSERVARIGKVFEGTYIDACLVVVDPTAGLPAPEDRAEYERLSQLLMGSHLDYQVVDTDVLLEGRLEPGQVVLRDLVVKAVLVPPVLNIEPALSTWLERFSQAGGLVIHVTRGFHVDDLLNQLRPAVKPTLGLLTGGQENQAVWSVHRRGGERDLWFLLNLSGQPQRVELQTAGGLREILLEEGAAPRLQALNGVPARTLEPFEACLLEAAGETITGAPLPLLEISLAGEMEIRPLSPNLARLYDWQLSLLDPQGEVLQSEAVQAIPLANQLEQGGFRFAPRFWRTFGTPPELQFPALRLRYACSFSTAYAGPIELVMEPGSIVGDWQLRVNSGSPLGLADFGPTISHVRGSLALPLAGKIAPGLNHLTIDVETDQPGGGLRNPLYLSGEFGVVLAPLNLVERPARGEFETYRANGLPFYAGVVEYRRSVQLAELPAGERLRVRLHPPAPFHEACQVSFNGGDWLDLPWSPYQVELPRRNLRQGDNQVALRAYTSLIRSFEGQEFDYTQHKYVAIE